MEETRAIKLVRLLDAKDYQWIFAIQRIRFQGRKDLLAIQCRAQRFYSSPVLILDESNLITQTEPGDLFVIENLEISFLHTPQNPMVWVPR